MLHSSACGDYMRRLAANVQHLNGQSVWETLRHCNVAGRSNLFTYVP